MELLSQLSPFSSWMGAGQPLRKVKYDLFVDRGLLPHLSHLHQLIKPKINKQEFQRVGRAHRKL